MKESKINCPAAHHRLCGIGIPATLEHSTESSKPDKGFDGKLVANIVHCFVTTIDSLRLGLVAVDQLHPLLSDLLRNLNHYKETSIGSHYKDTLKSWLISLNKRKANESLSSEEARQLVFDIEQAHGEFYQNISK